MDLVQELQQQRELLTQLLQQNERMLQEYGSQTAQPAGERPQERPNEQTCPLCQPTGVFKGRAVVAVVFPDGVRVETPTWKKVVETIMQRCNNDREKHDALMNLRNHVAGRSRQLLGSTKANMRSPLKIDRGLYMETHYDTETLLKIMLTRILEPVNYDYSGIRVVLRKV